MGLPALRFDHAQEVARPFLRLVTPQPKRTRKRSRKAAAHAARQNFIVFASLMTLAAVLGLGRVWVSVEATETSFEANRLRGDIKNERYEGDMLEVRQSALGSPSRIKAIAGSAMDMAPANEVTYLDIREAKKTSAPESTVQGRRTGVSGALARLLDLTAGEAQVLLVGDVGLATTSQ